MDVSQIVMLPTRVLSKEEREKLLMLHKACKLAMKAQVAYPFDWLIALLQSPTLVYATDVSMESARVTLYTSEGEPPLFPASR